MAMTTREEQHERDSVGTSGSHLRSGGHAVLLAACADGVRPTRLERAYLRNLLTRNKGNISRSAREAEIERKYLKDLMKKHGLRTPAGEDEDPQTGDSNTNPTGSSSSSS